jgi:hypothetical protein
MLHHNHAHRYPAPKSETAGFCTLATALADLGRLQRTMFKRTKNPLKNPVNSLNFGYFRLNPPIHKNNSAGPNCILGKCQMMRRKKSGSFGSFSEIQTLTTPQLQHSISQAISLDHNPAIKHPHP